MSQLNMSENQANVIGYAGSLAFILGAFLDVYNGQTLQSMDQFVVIGLSILAAVSIYLQLRFLSYASAFGMGAMTAIVYLTYLKWKEQAANAFSGLMGNNAFGNMFSDALSSAPIQVGWLFMLIGFLAMSFYLYASTQSKTKSWDKQEHNLIPDDSKLEQTTAQHESTVEDGVSVVSYRADNPRKYTKNNLIAIGLASFLAGVATPFVALFGYAYFSPDVVEEVSDISEESNDKQNTANNEATESKVNEIDIEELQAKAKKGDIEAQFQLGWKYHIGEGVVQDYEQAVYWYRIAAKQGNSWAQNNLGVLYNNGEGVKINKQLAYIYYEISLKIDENYKLAKENSKIVKNDLSKYQIAQADLIVKEWKVGDEMPEKILLNQIK